MTHDSRAALLDALLVYAEPFATDARVVVLGASGRAGVAERLLGLGARSVHVYDPDAERAAISASSARGISVRVLGTDFDVRDGAFDLAIVPDLGLLPDPAQALARLRRAVDTSGAVVAMARARAGNVDEVAFPDDVGPAKHEYTELYDLF